MTNYLGWMVIWPEIVLQILTEIEKRLVWVKDSRRTVLHIFPSVKYNVVY